MNIVLVQIQFEVNCKIQWIALSLIHYLFKQLTLPKRLWLDKEGGKAIAMISSWENDDPTNGWNMSTLFSFFSDAQDNFKLIVFFLKKSF